ncbi:39S ribosomal protein L52, mitochondrial-like [Centruroides sculpturatus]|uniref:39S ribosomal protein L52, mitochondrial-like n=1 Tax=Centruroides sculpturatus TaxID=218467 RepID=UPI000C6CFCC6|nr:39S ribosomal protein L52, mitochondrial-like [Centruroides sculpturatus]
MLVKIRSILQSSLRTANARFYYKSGTVVPPFKDPDLKKKQHGLTRTSLEPDPMVELPDWSYADGRPAPLGVHKKRRLLLQMHYAKIITDLLKEVDFAEKHHQEKQEEKKREEENIIKSKLKAKGKSLHAEKSKS